MQAQHKSKVPRARDPRSCCFSVSTFLRVPWEPSSAPSQMVAHLHAFSSPCLRAQSKSLRCVNATNSQTHTASPAGGSGRFSLVLFPPCRGATGSQGPAPASPAPPLLPGLSGVVLLVRACVSRSSSWSMRWGSQQNVLQSPACPSILAG